MNNRIEKVDFLSLMKLSKRLTGLVVDIWVDDSGYFRDVFSGRAVVLFPKMKGLSNDPENLTLMFISEETEICADSLNEIGLNNEELLQIKLFVRENKEKLLRLSDPGDEYDLLDFLIQMKTSGLYAEVNRTVLMTSRGLIEVVGPNSEGKLVLPDDWYDSEDDMYDKEYGELFAMMDMFDQIQKYSHDLLMNSSCGSEARSVLKEKRIPEDIWEKFGLGYLPDFNEWTSNLGYGMKYKELLKKYGIMSDAEAEGILSRFSDRLLFPVRDENGFCVEIWGRIIKADSSGIPIYSISRQISDSGKIFGLYEGLAEIQEKRVMILCEGPLDVLALQSAGLGNACSLLQFPISASQICLIGKICDKVIIMPDNDGYGQQEAEMTVERLKEEGLTGIVVNPKGIDPMTMYLNVGAASMKNYLNAVIFERSF